MNYISIKNFIKKIGISSIILTIIAVNITFVSDIEKANAQTAQPNNYQENSKNEVFISSSIASTLKNAIDKTKDTGAQNGLMRNQLVNSHSIDVEKKELALVDQLNSTLLNLENIQTRIATKSAETAASGTDTSMVVSWLASSSADIITAQNSISIFASSTIAASSIYQNPADISSIRKLASTAIADVNKVHDDLQSTLDTLTNIL